MTRIFVLTTKTKRKYLHDTAASIKHLLSTSILTKVGIQSSRKGRLKRRVYNLKGANHLWHIDTDHKLVKWYLIIFGASSMIQGILLQPKF